MEKISSSSGSSGSPRYLVTGVQTGSLSSKRLCHAVRMKTPLERLPPEGAGSTIGTHRGPYIGPDLFTPESFLLYSSSTLSGSKQPRDSPCRGPEYSSASLCLPVSDKGILCEKCIAQLEVLKEKTHSLLVPRDVASKDPKFGTFQLPVGATETWDEPGPLCDICGTHLSQLKQAAVHMVLTQEHAIWASPSSANIFTNSPASGVHTFPRISTSHSGPSEPRRVPGNLGMEKWVKGNQHLEVTSQSNGITVLPHEVSSEERKGKKKGAMPSAALCHLGTHLPSLPPRVSALLPMGTSAAVSFFVRAAQKLNLTTRRRRQGDESDLTTCQSNFSSILQTAPPPVPPSLFQVLNKGKESSGMGKVKVMLRVCPSFMEDSSQSHCFKLDTQKKQVTVLDPLSHVSLKTAGITFSPKTFTFDAVFSQETSQAEVCEGTLSEVLKSVIGGADGCIFSFGHTKVGTYYTMIGYDDCTQNLGIIPSAITWLFKLINKKKEKMGVNISVHISALEVCGKNEVLKDLLSGVDSGDLPDSHKPNVYLLEDPLSGIQLCNQSLQCASTAERAAYLLDVALTSRTSNVPGCSSVPKNSSHMFFTFHILQNHLDSSIKAAKIMEYSRLNLIHFGDCVGDSNKNITEHCLFDLGNVIMALLSGHKNKHCGLNKDSKLAMLLQESMGNINCHTVMIAHISASYGDLSESLCTIQIMSRLRREQKKAKKSASCSPRGRSMGRERKMHQSNGLRTFQLGDNVDHNLSLPQLCDLEDCYGSDKSCDTVIHVDPNGWVLPDKAVTSKTKAFVPIIPSLHTNKAETEKSLFSVQNEVSQPIETHVMRRQTEKEKNKQNQLPVANEGPSKPHQDCLKCNTFAELQERLYCIDGSELVSMSADALIKSEPMPSLTNGKEINRTATAMSARQLEIKSESKKDATICNTDKIPSAAHTKDDRLHPTDSQAYFQTQVSLGNQHCPEPFPRNEAPVAMALPLDNQKMFLDDPLLQSDMRISPVGKSSSSSFSSTLSANLTSPVTDSVMCNDVIPQSSTEIPKKEMKATITITVQHPLDLNGQDELVYTVVEELTIDSGAIERDRSTNIISFNDSRIKSLVSGSQPGRIVSSITEEQKIIDVSSSAMTSDGKPPKPLPNSPAGNIISCQVSSSNLTLNEINEVCDTECSFEPYTKQTESLTDTQKLNVFSDGTSDCLMDSRDETSLMKFSSGLIYTNGVNRKNREAMKNTLSASKGRNSSINPSGNGKYVERIKSNVIKQPCTDETPSVKMDAKTGPTNPLAFRYTEMNINQTLSISKPKEPLSEEKAERRTPGRRSHHGKRQYSKGAESTLSPVAPRKLPHDFKTESPRKQAPTGYSTNSYVTTTSLPRNWSGLYKRDGTVDDCPPCMNTKPKQSERTTSVPPSPRRTLERRQSLTKQCIFAWAKQSLPIPSMWKCSPNQKRTSSMQPSMSSSPEESDMSPLLTARREIGKDSPRSPVEESSRLFSARLEQLTNRSHSLRGSPLDFSDLDSLKKSDSMISLASSGSVEGYCPAGSVDRKSLEQCINMATHGSKGEWDPVMHRLGRSSRRVPKFFPIHDSDRSNSTESCKDNQSKTSNKHVSDPKVHTLPVTCSKDSTFSPKSTKRSLNRSSSLSPNGVSYNRNVWRTQSLTRNQGSGLITKSSQKVMNGRISELLQTSRESLSSRGQMCSDLEENKSSKGKVPLLVHTLPSPYSRITAPRKPNYCSGHASDNTSVLSGELPPAMCKTALLYNRNSMFSSGYESMMRDSEATCSSISTRESISDRSCPLNSSKGAKGSRKRSKTGQRRPSQDTLLSLRRSCSGPKVHWVDRGVSDSYEIKVYEIDDVERLQKKGEAGNKGVICFSAKLKFLEHRQQRIAEVRAKYNALKRELEILKQHLMVDPRKWIQEFDLWQTFEVDSLEHLEALELVTERLESRVTRCKARLMMVTCFDVTPKHKGKRRCWQVLDHKGFVGI